MSRIKRYRAMQGIQDIPIYILEPKLKILISKAQFKHVVKKSNNKNYEGGHKDDRSNSKKKQGTLFQGKEMDHGILVQDEP